MKTQDINIIGKTSLLDGLSSFILKKLENLEIEFVDVWIAARFIF
jgi:hypothetical protein